MAITVTKLLALAVATGYAIVAVVTAPSAGMIVVAVALILGPLALIWFPEYLGGSWTKRKK